ncbi:MAG TPA: adenylate/guanylate cyclase domain-containing protein [Magnetospirillum sp.]|nr:adenylate/guanylate cyclase domain-containing protein [Magnetospirillum sp.]
MGRIRVKLRVGIAMMFLVVVVPLTVVLIGVLFQQNTRIAHQMANQVMELAAREATVAATGLIGDLSNAVELSVAFGRAQQEALRRPETMRPLLDELERMPATYSLYFGLHEDGDFFQVIRLSPGIKRFGPQGAEPPSGAKWVLRTIEASTGERRDTYVYLASWGKVLRVERADPQYDPRKRPWYEAAIGADTVASSGVYVFSGTGQPGLTLSRRLTTEDNVRLGVFGADLSMAALAEFLKGQKVGETGITFILNEQGQLIGYPDIAKSVISDGGKVALVRGDAVSEPAVAAAVRAFQGGGASSLSVNVDGQAWLAHFRPFPEGFGRRWTVGVVVAEDDFIAPLKRASLTIIFLGLGFIMLATVGIVGVSRVLARPILDLIGETERIRRFELDGPVCVRSPVQEIDRLAAAVGSMKAGLASFGTYVPKSLVQDIIRSGVGTGVGGSRRPLTVMFTDIANFTSASERMEPEQVLNWLSDYFDAMSQAVHSHGGTIDKFIGDAIMAIWNAPVEDDDHVGNACRAMLACRRAARVLGASGGPSLRTRMGLHTGTAMVGNVGSSDRMQYTALGGMVNLASRVEGLNKQFGTELLVTEAVARAVGERFLLRPLGPVVVAGASVPVALYELLGEAGDPRGGLDQWLAAWQCWEARDWTGAVAGFEAYVADHAADDSARRFLDSSRRFADQGVPADWDGILRFTSK